MNIRGIFILAAIFTLSALSVQSVIAADSPVNIPATERVPNAGPGVKVAKPKVSIEDNIYVKKRRMSLQQLYKKVLLAFEHNGYFVTFEPNIGKSMRPFAQRWGRDYNKNRIEEIRSMVLSNPWHANKIANADPYLLAMFPLSVTLIQKGRYTTILFVRPSKVATYSRRGRAAAAEMEKDVIRIFENIL